MLPASNLPLFKNLPLPIARSPLARLLYKGMSIPNRTEINRANAQHSTGPKSSEGKKQSSLNALRRGLIGQIVVMPTEDLQAYQQHVKSFTDELNPKGVIEANLVQALADTSWRLNRVAALETNLLTLSIATGNSFTDAPQQIRDAMSIVSALESQSKALSNLSLHSQRFPPERRRRRRQPGLQAKQRRFDQPPRQAGEQKNEPDASQETRHSQQFSGGVG
jgi:hypothetical protein